MRTSTTQSNTSKVAPIPNHTPPAGDGANHSIHAGKNPEKLLERVDALNHGISRAIDDVEVSLVERKELYAIQCECGCDKGAIGCWEARKEGGDDVSKLKSSVRAASSVSPFGDARAMTPIEAMTIDSTTGM